MFLDCYRFNISEKIEGSRWYEYLAFLSPCFPENPDTWA